ncbi:uncharacterized protein LOC124644623 [Helicoverpa zea]|uniref:uncharacterized protein LOC124644623 n=1 Tax=Helicoverpa zea TaxID=7113 RepID=UPI001F56207D|nr:uncharacterized protein LOC124644623 [Helicoverpa zea]
MASIRSLKKMLRLLLFYILLQSAAATLENDHKDNSVPEMGTEKTSYRDKIMSAFKILYTIRSLNNATGNEQLDSVLTTVTEVLDQIRNDFLELNENGFLEIEIPEKHGRHRRDVSNETTETTSVENNVNDSNVTTTETPVTVTETVTTTTTLLPKEVKETNSTKNENGRRMLSLSASTKMKAKLLSYLEDTFAEVEMKIKPLTSIKIKLSNDNIYRIGYIIATIDTLEVNLKKMRTDMGLNQDLWSDEKIIELFDRIKAASTAATRLIDTLRKYLP